KPRCRFSIGVFAGPSGCWISAHGSPDVRILSFVGGSTRDSVGLPLLSLANEVGSAGSGTRSCRRLHCGTAGVVVGLWADEVCDQPARAMSPRMLMRPSLNERSWCMSNPPLPVTRISSDFGTNSCIKLQRPCACDEGKEPRTPTRLKAATAELLLRMTVILP